MRFFIIHGAYGSPEENWFPWLKQELESLGHEVIIPKFPTPEGQSLDKWFEVMNEYRDLVDENTVFIGHSLGPAFIFHVLQRYSVTVKAIFLIAGFVGDLDNSDFDPINKTFTKGPFEWDLIKMFAGKVVLFQSENDPYVPFMKGLELARNLDAELKVIADAGHFNKAAGYDKFPRLLEEIKKIK